MEPSDDGSDYLVVTRENYEHVIIRAGKPDKTPESQRDGSLRLSPRGSFGVWREERVGYSMPCDTPIAKRCG